MFHLRFKPVQWNGNVERLPMVPVELAWGGRSLKTQMLLDTGANATFVERWIAQRLRLPLGGPVEQARGATGTMAVVHSELDLRIARRSTIGVEDEFRRIAPVSVPAGPHDPLPYSVLGRWPFMLPYEITYRENDETIILREIASRRGRQRP